MSDSWSGTGYDAEASTGGGLWLRLKKKGDKARVRLVSIPYRWVEKYTDQTGKNIEARKAAWLAIHKEVLNGTPLKSVVVFSSSAMVYGAVRTLAESEDWGDPTGYDIVVERTEESPAKYYTVTPIPRGMGPLTEEDLEMVKAANIDWPNICIQAIAKKADAPPNHSDRDTPPEEEDPFA
jgi:hypothetical protein